MYDMSLKLWSHGKYCYSNTLFQMLRSMTETMVLVRGIIQLTLAVADIIHSK